MQFECGIGKRSRKRERWAEGADNNVLRLLSKDDEAANQDVVAGLDRRARGNICELGIGGGVEIVNLDDRDSGSAVDPADDGGVSARLQRGDYRGFLVVAGGNGVNDLRLIRAVAPII